MDSFWTQFKFTLDIDILSTFGTHFRILLDNVFVGIFQDTFGQCICGHISGYFCIMYLWTPLVRVQDTFPMDTISGYCMYTILGVYVDTLKDTFTLTTVSRYGLLDFCPYLATLLLISATSISISRDEFELGGRTIRVDTRPVGTLQH